METTQPVATLHNLLDYDADKFTSAEIQLKNVLPEWINKAQSMQLKAVLQRYLDFVKQHAEKLGTFYEEEKIISLSLHNRIMHAFIEDTMERLSVCSHAQVKDACLVACLQTINHYKISTYGTAAAFAKALGMEKAAGIFHEAEINEKQIDDRLSQLAEFEINAKARTPLELHE